MKYLSKLLFISISLLVATASADADTGLSSTKAELQTFTKSSVDGLNCYTTFYQTKDAGCIDRLLSALPEPAGGTNPGLLGFFAEIFISNPQERTRLLAKDVRPSAMILFLEALDKAGMQDMAQTYASAHGFVRKGVQPDTPATLKQIKPVSNPADNDLLIGAFMASGNKAYIRTILGNFSTADDGMARDSLRLSMMQGRFGPTFAAPGRSKVMMQAACQKYECKKDMYAFMRVITLSSAYWALGSLSQQHADIQETYSKFFESDPRLKQILASEQNAFSNYVTALAVFNAIKDNTGINDSLSIYESLGSAQDAVAIMAGKKTISAAAPEIASGSIVKLGRADDHVTSSASDPIQENFGTRPSPYPGFLALPPEAVLPDFKEVKHHYTKREYTIDFTRMVDGKKIDLNIVESDNAQFLHGDQELVQEFKHQGITGQVYVYHNQKTLETSFNLIWLNPPKQRIAIYLTQTPSEDYSPKDLITILTSMKNVR